MLPIRLTTLIAHNAMRFQRLKIGLNDQGLVLVRGINHDADPTSSNASNGASKSAIFEILRHILMGQTARKIKGKQLVRAGSEGGYVGQLAFEKDGHNYTVRQAIGHSKYGSTMTLFRDGKPISHKRKKVQTQKVVSAMLGMTPEQFDSWVFISQEAAHPLVNGTGPECSAYLAESFGLTIFDEMRTKLKEAVKATDRQLGEADAIEHMLVTVRARRDELGDVGENQRLQFELQEANTALATEVAGLESQRDENYKLLQLLTQRDSVASRMRPFVDLLESAEQTSEDLKTRRDSLVKKIKQIDEKLGAAREIANRQKFRQDIEEKFADLTKKLSETMDLTDKTAEQHTVISGLEQEIEKLVVASSVLGRLEPMNGMAQCPTCGQDVDAEHIAAEIALAERAAEKLADVRQALQGVKAELRQLTAAQQTRVQRQAERKRLRAQLLELPEGEEAVDIADLQRRRTGLRNLTERLDNFLPVLRQWETLPAVPNENPDRIKEAISSLTRRIGEQKARTDANYRRIVELTVGSKEAERLAEQAAQHEARLASIEQVRRENDLRRTLAKAMARLKVRKTHGIVQAIQATVPSYVAAMFGHEDVRIEVDDENPDSIERWCSTPHPTVPGKRERIPVQAMSKGEKAKLRVAFIWAVRKLMRPERTVNILILDEADGGLDPVALEAYGGLLEQLREEYESVFVISHRRELGSVRFDRVWTVEKKNGISRLSI